jgi:hypothetical protein
MLMRVVSATIGSNEVLLETIDENIELVGGKKVRATKTTGFEDKFDASWYRAKEVVASISKDVKGTIEEISKHNQPQHIELEFNLGFSSKLDMWVVTGEGSCGFKFKLQWDT